MKTLDLLTTASGNIWRSKLRTFLTVTAVFIGAFTLTLTTGIGSGISSYIEKEVNNLGAKDVLIVQPKGSDEIPGSTKPKKYDPNTKVVAVSDFRGSSAVITDADLGKIEKIKGIESVEPAKSVAPDYIAGENNQKYQVRISQFIPGSNLTLTAGKQVISGTTVNQVILPGSYVSTLGYKKAADAIGKTVTLGISSASGKQRTTQATVIGVQQSGLAADGGVTANRTLLDQLYKFQSEGLPQASTNQYQLVFAKFDSNYTTQQKAELKKKLSNAGYTGQTVQDQIGTFTAVIDGIILVLNAFAVIALLAASFGIINTLLMSVQERTKEIGLMKAMGMGGGRIFSLFSFEAISLGFWGSVIGVAVAAGVGQIANKIVSEGFLKELVGLQIFAFTPQNIAGIIALVVGIAFLAGTLPASKAARKNPIDSLRYE